MSGAEVACSYAALILHDEGLPVDGANIQKLLDAAKIEVESYWPGLFARCLGSRNIGELLVTGGGGAAPVAAAAAAPAAAAAAAAAAPAKEEEKKKSSSAAGADLGGGLFGGDDGW